MTVSNPVYWFFFPFWKNVNLKLWKSYFLSDYTNQLIDEQSWLQVRWNNYTETIKIPTRTIHAQTKGKHTVSHHHDVEQIVQMHLFKFAQNSEGFELHKRNGHHLIELSRTCKN